MWPNPKKTADFDTFTEEILNGKRYFLCSDSFFQGAPVIASEGKFFTDKDKFFDALLKKGMCLW